MDHLLVSGFSIVLYVSCCFLILIVTGTSTPESETAREDIYMHATSTREETFSEPSVLLAIIARNEEKTLPTYLALIERLQYPKERISIFIQTDHNEDKTLDLLKEWQRNMKESYHNIGLVSNDSATSYQYSQGPNHWLSERYKTMMKLRQKALDEARRQWADFIFFIDCDNFLLNPITLRKLIAMNKTVIAPMLREFDNGSAFSNFWYGIDQTGYYKRTPEYLPTLRRNRKGCFEVPMIHSTYLIDLRRNITDDLRYYPPHSTYTGQWDDILVFAHSVRVAGVKLYILNEDDYGRMLPQSTDDMTMEDDQITFTDAVIDWIAYHKPLPMTKHIITRPPPINNMGFNEIYMINLARRPDRRKRMLLSLQELGLMSNQQDAVDGRQLSTEMLTELGITPMTDFKDPFLKRPLTMGEIGCFLSHWRIWEEMAKHGLEQVLVLEDDIRFEPDFKRKLRHLLEEAEEVLPQVEWDLIYLGRKRMSRIKEDQVLGTSSLVWAKYSYWTLGYIIRLSGARKLLAGEPFNKMIPVDEYIPVMFDDHSDIDLKEKFSPRDLIVLSSSPLLLFPTHYIGDSGYFSDTEDTLTVFGKTHTKPKQKGKGKENIDVESPKAVKEKTQTNFESHGGEL